MRTLGFAFLTLLVALIVPSAHRADAAFPGLNGKIAFVSERGGSNEIWLMNGDGTGQTQLTNTGGGTYYDTAWSPDGRKLASSFAPPNEDNDIYVMNADGTGRIQVTNTADYDDAPAWSPDGSRIAFTRESTSANDADVYVVDSV